MCTVSWTASARGYDLFFNRDELHSRAPESPPVVAARDGMAYIAPRDGQHGGTWLAVNHTGLTVGLLNDYGVPWRPSLGQSRCSRGHIVNDCMNASNHGDVQSIVRAQPLVRTMPFQLIAVSPEEGALMLKWQGDELLCHEPTETAPPLSSSSFATAEVIAARIRRFTSFVASPRNADIGELSAYHRQHDPSAPAHSVLMRRSDAATRSICHITVDQTQVRLSYFPVSSDGVEPIVQTSTTLTLNRRTSATVAV